MKTTPFTNIHEQLGAKMVDFAGYRMPISYTSIQEEHLAVRKNIGLFDVSHMGQFIVRGQGALTLIQYLSSNDASKLSVGQIQYSCLLRPDGGIVDDMLVYCLQENGYMLVVNAANVEKDWRWLQQHKTNDVELIDISPRTALLAVQGPKAAAILQPLTTINLENMPYYTFVKGRFAGMDKVLVSATGYTGAGGFEIYVDNQNSVAIWKAIMAIGKDAGLQVVGLGARDTLRLEMGFCLYGNDIDENTHPIEANLSWITKLKGKDCIAKTNLLNYKKAGIQRKLVGFELEGKRIARKGYAIYNKEGKRIGTVTSGSFSPSLQKAIGMGYINKPYHKTGSDIWIQIRRKTIAAKVVKRPFYTSS